MAEKFPSLKRKKYPGTGSTESLFFFGLFMAAFVAYGNSEAKG